MKAQEKRAERTAAWIGIAMGLCMGILLPGPSGIAAAIGIGLGCQALGYAMARKTDGALMTWPERIDNVTTHSAGAALGHAATTTLL